MDLSIEIPTEQTNTESVPTPDAGESPSDTGESPAEGRSLPWDDAAAFWSSLSAATAQLPAPLGVLELRALRHNAHGMLARANGKPIRVASKSLRVRELLDSVLALDGYQGILAFTLAEALWLATDHDDIVVGYPTADRAALSALLADPQAADRITLMVDDLAQLDIIDAIAAPNRRPELRIAIDVDASWRAKVLGHVGVRRSPLHTADEAGRFARIIAKREGFKLVGLMMYEAQIAGQPDEAGVSDPVIRWVQQQSGTELQERRAAVVTAIEEIAALEFVNGGGTGSLEYTSADAAVTEVTAGSGLTAGHLFDGYRAFDLAPALAFAFDVVRRPRSDIATVLGGGWIASGPATDSRQPLPVWPAGLKMLGREGAGEVQTPLEGANVRQLEIGDRVWFRHAKSGEVAERLNEYQLVDDGRLLGAVPTYRGEGKAFL